MPEYVSQPALMTQTSCFKNDQECCLEPAEQQELCNFLKKVIFIEREIESAKIDLALRSDFNLVDAFRLFDLKQLGCITT